MKGGAGVGGQGLKGKEKGLMSRPKLDLIESRDGPIHYLTFQSLDLILQFLKRLFELQIYMYYLILIMT